MSACGYISGIGRRALADHPETAASPATGLSRVRSRSVRWPGAQTCLDSASLCFLLACVLRSRPPSGDHPGQAEVALHDDQLRLQAPTRYRLNSSSTAPLAKARPKRGRWLRPLGSAYTPTTSVRIWLRPSERLIKGNCLFVLSLLVELGRVVKQSPLNGCMIWNRAKSIANQNGFW